MTPQGKPWERAGASDGPSPFAPPSVASSTASVVAASGATSTDQKDEIGRNATITDGVATGRPMPPRPWEQNRTGYGTGAVSNYGGYGGGMYGGGLGSSSYGGGLYGGGLGSSMYGSNYGGVGGGMYGSRYGGYGGMSGGYGGGYGYGMGGMGGGYGMGGMGGMGPGDPNFPGGPPQPPNFWQSLLQGLSGVMQFFGRLAMLVNENTQAFHFFISALLQLCDRAGSLYGELARFVLHVLGFRKGRARSKASGRALDGTELRPGQSSIAAAPTPELAWDNVWQDEGKPRP